MIDLFNTHGYMKSGVPIWITYTRSIPEFYVIQDNTTEKNVYRFEITKLCLLVPVVKVTETLTPKIERLFKTVPARYHFESINAKHNLTNTSAQPVLAH